MSSVVGREGDVPIALSAANAATGKPATEASLSHITTLDGLRGVAVLLVLFFHFGWTFPEDTAVAHFVHTVLWTGWTGVDLFFVLSGYLITRGLVAKSSKPVGERMRLFWTRRFLRIFPLYYAFILVGSVVALGLGGWIPGVSYWLYVQNYALAFDIDPLHWTSHLWSLAIEEQFYFLWPLFALLAPRKARVPVTILLALSCMVLRASLVVVGPHLMSAELVEHLVPIKLAYRATPTHMDGLLFGALLAILAADAEHPVAKIWTKVRPAVVVIAALGVLGLTVHNHGFGTYDKNVVIIGYALLALMFTGFVSIAVDGKLWSPFRTFLLSRPMRACGRVSYGMYILHWPLVALSVARIEEMQKGMTSSAAMGMGVAIVVVGTLVVYLAAEVSFRFLESPFLKLKERFHG